MKNILAFSFFPAFVPPSNGGQARLFNFYKALSRWHKITLLTSGHVGVDEEVINHGLNFVERRIPKGEYFVQQYTELEKYSGGGDISGPAIAACANLPTRLHDAYLKEYPNADVIIHDSPFTADYDIFADFDKKPRLYNSYNCETALYSQMHLGDKCSPIHDLVRSSEKRLLSYADLILYCNDADLKLFKELAPDAEFEALYTPNGMTLLGWADRAIATGVKDFRAVFIGSGHPPNVLAAKFIADRLAPALPNISFDVIGSCLPEDRYPTNLIRHGVVEDRKKVQILRRANIALNPMEQGSGSNVKVLDYFSFELPVLSTAFGMRGIEAHPGIDYLEADLDQWVDLLQRVIEDRNALASIGASGKKLASARYTWDVIAQSVAEKVDALANSVKKDEGRYILALNDYDSFESIGGGATRTQGLYEAVSEWSPVVFLTFSGDGTLRARKKSGGITLIKVPKTADHIADVACVNSQFHISADDILASRHCTRNAWLMEIYRVLRTSARCIVIEHCYLARLPLTWNDRFVYSSHNNETELKRQLLEWHPLKADLTCEVEHIERLAVECAAAIIAVSHEDAESLVKGKRTSGPVIVVRNGASMPVLDEEVNRLKLSLCDQVGDRSAVFLGSAHMPNVEAAKFIVEELAPKLPEIFFHLIGSVCSSILYAPRNVRLWGVVDEKTKSAIMQSCFLALNPMNAGSGSNVKLADYLSYGLFVVTTEFGRRGYPNSIKNHIVVSPLDRFSEAIRSVLSEPELNSIEKRLSRQSLFKRELSMRGIAKNFVEVLKSLECRKKRILFVTYRYVSPTLGGAEANIEKFVKALGYCQEFDVDVIAPEISGIHNHWRFCESYSFDSSLGVPIDIPNVRFARFPVEEKNQAWKRECLRKAWRAQPLFERSIDRQLVENYSQIGITWGWSFPEGEGTNSSRWAFSECGMFISEASAVGLQGYAPHPIVITASESQQMIAGPWSVEGSFHLTFQAPPGSIEFHVSAPVLAEDYRPLGFLVSLLTVEGKPLDLAAPTLVQKTLATLPAKDIFRILDRAANESRAPHGVRLTDGRGPWSPTMESFIKDHVKEYDLVVTHNNIFRPAVVAIEEAHKQGVPSLLIPHIHLDDDFYHFPDLIESARKASLVLAVPKAACDFLAEKGCNVRFLPAGCDADEQFTHQDQAAFRKVYPSMRPFVLVLGRKAGAKGYQGIINAVEQLNREGLDLLALLIGPDDDGVEISSPNAVYLGRQPREVVRGALKSCVALVNMSSSESFGIVLLEAWLAGKPVIANKDCAGFQDIATHNLNSLLVTDKELPRAIRSIIDDADMAAHFSVNGRETAFRFDWSNVSQQFLDCCLKLIKSRQDI